MEVKDIIDIFTRRPGDYGQPHTSYHILYYCKLIDGSQKISCKSLEIGFYDFRQISGWHRDHFEMIEKANDFLNNMLRK